MMKRITKIRDSNVVSDSVSILTGIKILKEEIQDTLSHDLRTTNLSLPWYLVNSLPVEN